LRVALTGFGLVCAAGRSVDEAWPRILRGAPAIGQVELFDVEGQRASIAAEVKGLVPPRHDGPFPWSRTDTMAFEAAREALRSADLDPKRARVGLVVGGTTGGMFETEELLARMHADPALRRPNPEMLAHPLSATADRLGGTLGPFARARTVCSACSSGANAFAVGAAWLALGVVDAVLVGGTDALCRLTYTGFNALGAIDPEPARPFHAARRGLTIGEGAGFAVLETPERARQRGVRWEAELVGIGITSEAHHITNPAEEGTYAARAIELALRSAGLAPTAIDYVNAHGTATPLNDAMEARALRRALGDALATAWVSSTKGTIGHTLGAAGAIEAVLTALAIRDGRLPPTAGLSDVDPVCADLRHVPREGIATEVRAALSNAFGFGGVDTVLALARPGFAGTDPKPPRACVVTGVGTTSAAGTFRATENVRLFGAAASLDHDPASGLDPARARRLDRGARLGTIAAHLAGANGDDGVVMGTSYGDADASAAFLAKLFEKGPRRVPPADFPNLVPSSPTGHVSIYLGLHGPAIATADLATSGESAIATVFELVASSAIDAAVAGGIEGPSLIAANCIAPAFRALDAAHEETGSDRTEGAAAVRIAAIGDGPRLVDVAQGLDARELVVAIARPPGRAAVVAAEANDAVRAAVAGTAWSDLPIRDVVSAVGRHEGLGGFAVAAAAAAIMAREIDVALVVGPTAGRAYAILLARA
jgi:3-oxoacyl-[acyl-carrier-protein] synthase II